MVACRVSPSQKAEICKCVKRFLQKTTLCIGDGANDVAMILEAHVGVGIAGMEGSQAVNNADFALCKFRDLERLVLIHGRWAYLRLGYVCMYILYKNITFCLLFGIFAFYSGYSGQMVYDEWALAGYNVIFTSLPVLIIGFFEQDVGAQTSIAYPILYRPGQTDGKLNFKPLFIGWNIEAFWHAIVVFYFTFMPVASSMAPEGRDPSIWDAGNAAFTANVLIVTVRISIDTMYWTYIHLIYPLRLPHSHTQSPDLFRPNPQCNSDSSVIAWLFFSWWFTYTQAGWSKIDSSHNTLYGTFDYHLWYNPHPTLSTLTL